MKRRVLLQLLVGFACVAGLFAASFRTRPLTTADLTPTPVPATAPGSAEEELRDLQGTWDYVSTIRDGEESREVGGRCRYVFAGATMTVQPEGRQHSFYTVQLDPSVTPKRFDIVATWPDGHTSGVEALYELRGDTFRWCHVEGRRPAAFLSAASEEGTIVTLRRPHP